MPFITKNRAICLLVEFLSSKAPRTKKKHQKALSCIKNTVTL